MRHRATHLLHVLACAPVAAGLAATLALSPHAAAGAPSPATPMQAPTPFVIAVDPGHGGSPDNDHPDQQVDPGVVATNGLQEKDVTLDVAKRLVALLQNDQVRVILTRKDDTFVGIQDRMQQALDGGAQLFVSIHFNSFTDPATGGDLVLYPGDASLPFAQTMSDTVGGEMQSWGLADDGVQPKTDLWVHATMPAATVEGAYLTNAHEAQLLTESAFRDALARAIHDGILKQAPQITALRAQILAWKAAHRITLHPPGAAAGGTQAQLNGVGGTAGGGGHSLLKWFLFFVLLGAGLRWRRRWIPAVGHAIAALTHTIEQRDQQRRRGRARARRDERLGRHALTLATTWAADRPLTRRLPTHRKRRSSRRREILLRSRPVATRQSVYDELWF